MDRHVMHDPRPAPCPTTNVQHTYTHIQTRRSGGVRHTHTSPPPSLRRCWPDRTPGM
ncbi:hypothetical protein Micbo1qcDRAFT_167147, partial [Microdochium bolleyi]